MVIKSLDPYPDTDSLKTLDPNSMNPDPQPVLRIRIHRIHVFLGLQDPDPDPGSGSGSGSIGQSHGSADPDPPQNVMDPQHCPQHYLIPFLGYLLAFIS